MIIFLNMDGTAEKVVPSHIFQGSANVTEVGVLSPYAETTALTIAFRLPDGTKTDYRVMQFQGMKGECQLASYTYSIPRSVTALAGDVYVSLNAVFPDGNMTSFSVKIIVEKSILPELPPEPEPDIYELLLRYIQRNAAWIAALDERVTRLEDVTVRKVMRDLTCVVENGYAVFTKWYTDGTTGSFTIPLSGGGGESGQGGLVTVTFTEDSWINVAPVGQREEYELAFAPEQTGMASAQFLANLEKKDSYSYEVGDETEPSLREGYSTLADRVFKGSDGSILLTGVRVPYAGELILYNGKIGGKADNVTGLSLTPDGKGIVIHYLNAPDETLYPDFYSREEVDALIAPFTKDISADDWNAEPTGYFYTVLASEHGKGIDPTVYFKATATNALVSPGVTVSGEGNVELSASVNLALRIIIR